MPEHSKPNTSSVLAHLLQLVERERQRPVDEPRDLEAVRGRVDIGMAVVLRREELVARRELAADLADVDDAPVGGRRQVDVRRQVGERHQRLALRKGGQRPFRKAKDPEARNRQAAFENVATSVLFRHGEGARGCVSHPDGDAGRGSPWMSAGAFVPELALLLRRTSFSGS